MERTRVPVVVGVGNPLFADDGMGLRAIELLAGRAPPGVRVVEGGLAVALSLLSEIEEASHLLVLDVVDVGARPGDIVRLVGAELPRSGSPMLSPHHLNVVDVLDLARLRGRHPDEVIVLGIQPGRIEPGTVLSPEVEAALPGLVEEALAQLRRWVRAPERSQPGRGEPAGCAHKDFDARAGPGGSEGWHP